MKDTSVGGFFRPSLNALAIRCEEHGRTKDRAGPHARERALQTAQQDPPAGVSASGAVAETRDVLGCDGRQLPGMSGRRMQKIAAQPGARAIPT